jgi:hypothetical protein
MPVESQNSTPDMSTMTRDAGAALAMTAASSLCSRGAVYRSISPVAITSS